jgi:hypothetical protein
MSAANTTKSTRVTNVQVPGEAPKSNLETAAGGVGGDATSAGGATSGSAPTNEAPKAERAAVDLDAMRAQIREEERANARAELGQQIQAASTVIAAPAPMRSKADYRNMRAVDIDPATLTAPVMTLDGYLCPPAPEAKK